METNAEQTTNVTPSDFLNLKGIEYFMFEEDFMENNIRCIPMVIRFKLDRVGIKLKLSEWTRFSREEKIGLALINCNNNQEVRKYTSHLTTLIKKYTSKTPEILEPARIPSWDELKLIPEILNEKLKEFGWHLSIEQWISLTDLQRFALLKLCRPGHENKNFPKAMKEFNLVD
ncbi:MAG TPA: nitrate reductase associated protein [Chitinophagaceae bacterium]|nr:nitrate reductase associated protein [Chitinophagaceae bacterium]